MLAPGAAPRCPCVVVAPIPEAVDNSLGSAVSFAQKEPLKAFPGDAHLGDDATNLSEMPPPPPASSCSCGGKAPIANQKWVFLS